MMPIAVAASILAAAAFELHHAAPRGGCGIPIIDVNARDANSRIAVSRFSLHFPAPAFVFAGQAQGRERRRAARDRRVGNVLWATVRVRPRSVRPPRQQARARRGHAARVGGRGHLDQGGEGSRLGHRQVGQHLAVHLDAGPLQAGDEHAVAGAVLAAGRVDALNPEEWSGFAFGFGLDRLALMRHGIDDLRELFRNDHRFLSQF
mgnify:CR=1 FL=1